MERVTEKYAFFWGSEFSNWYYCPITYKGIEFFNTEQIFMWEKAMFFNDTEIADKIIKSDGNPSVAKKLGRQVKNFDSNKWLEEGYKVMVKANLAKYQQNPILRNILLGSGDRIIVEASPHDIIWGVGIHWIDDNILDEKNWRGQNLLGKALMEVRENIKSELGMN